MDVNKAPFPIVNVIADRPNSETGSSRFLKSNREGERMRERAFAKQQLSFDKMAGDAVGQASALLKRVVAMHAVVKKALRQQHAYL